MRRYWVLALAVLTLLGGLAPPAFAQAPAPKVTISGLVDFVTSWSKNLEDPDPTRNKDTSFFSRQRGVLNVTGEVGKVKGVWALEFDLINGHTPVAHRATNSTGFDLDNDVVGVNEQKWLYLEFPLTGPGSLLPFIDVPTTARAGGQPITGHSYKLGVGGSSGDLAGLNLVTTFAPQVKNQLTYVQIEEGFGGRDQSPALGPTTPPARGSRATGFFAGNREGWAILDSLEFALTKELTVKPTFAFQQLGGAGTAGSANSAFTYQSRGGFAPTGERVWRSSVGGDARWRSGPWSLEPTFFYQFGEQHLPAATRLAINKSESDIRAFYGDVVGGWRSGPLNLEGRFVYTSGNKADECVQRINIVGVAVVCQGGSDVNYYTAIPHTGAVYWNGWTEIWSTATEYYNALFLVNGPNGMYRAFTIGFDKYGLITFAVRGTYAVTPAFSLVGILSPSWTAEKVDTNGAVTATGVNPTLAPGQTKPKGDDRYLGTEIVAGFDWRFAPAVTFTLRYAHLFAGDALNQCQSGQLVVGVLVGCSTTAGVTVPAAREAKDIDNIAARVGFRF